VFIHNGKTYSSKKHPMLEHIFQKYFDATKNEERITFYLSDISEGYREMGIAEPASISNTILDLCRKRGSIELRVPPTISALGYDLKKKTGPGSGGNYAGEFVFVGVGKQLLSWLDWVDDPELIEVDSTPIPPLARKIVRNDEAGLFSIMDYLDVLSKVMGHTVYRVQNPMKWQPNEIDGFYTATVGQDTYVYPVEAKALTTGDDINLDQMDGGFRTVIAKFDAMDMKVGVQQIAVRMIKNGIDIAIFPANLAPVQPDRFVRVVFNPIIENWK